MTKFKDTDRISETHIGLTFETKTIANMTLILTHAITLTHAIMLTHTIKLRMILARQIIESIFFPNVSFANIMKQPSGMRRPSNIPAYVPPQLPSPMSQISETDLDLAQGNQSLFETLERLCGSVTAISKFVDSRIKWTFVSDYVSN